MKRLTNSVKFHPLIKILHKNREEWRKTKVSYDFIKGFNTALYSVKEYLINDQSENYKNKIECLERELKELKSGNGIPEITKKFYKKELSRFIISLMYKQRYEEVIKILENWIELKLQENDKN